MRQKSARLLRISTTSGRNVRNAGPINSDIPPAAASAFVVQYHGARIMFASECRKIA